MPEMQARQTCRAPVVRGHTPVGLWLAVLAAVVACALAAPVLLPQADGGPCSHAGDETDTGRTLADLAYRSRCSAVLRDSAVVRRSLSRCSASFTASEARVVTLALKLRASKRHFGRLVRENAELRARLEAVAETVRAEATAGSVNGNMRTAAHMREPGRNAYPPLPGSGTRPAHSDASPVAALRSTMPHCACDRPHIPRSPVHRKHTTLHSALIARMLHGICGVCHGCRIHAGVMRLAPTRTACMTRTLSSMRTLLHCGAHSPG
jgi:hypothetical protein